MAIYSFPCSRGGAPGVRHYPAGIVERHHYVRTIFFKKSCGHSLAVTSSAADHQPFRPQLTDHYTIFSARYFPQMERNTRRCAPPPPPTKAPPRPLVIRPPSLRGTRLVTQRLSHLSPIPNHGVGLLAVRVTPVTELALGHTSARGCVETLWNSVNGPSVTVCHLFQLRHVPWVGTISHPLPTLMRAFAHHRCAHSSVHRPRSRSARPPQTRPRRTRQPPCT